MESKVVQDGVQAGRTREDTAGRRRASILEKVRYMISDAANLVDVESHVLRYWEDELELNIPRNEMGHRYYTKDNIQEFQKIKELKEQGYQLKAIRMIVHNGTLNPEEADMVAGAIRMPQQDGGEMKQEAAAGQISSAFSVLTTQTAMPHQTPSEYVASRERQQSTPVMSNPDKMAQFEQLMSEILKKALAENNDELSRAIGEEVSEQVIKEMNYLAREQEEAQETRFRQLDSAIRGNLRKKEKKLPRFRMSAEPKTT